MITPVEAFRRLAPNAHAQYVEAFAAGQDLFETFEITTPLRLAHYLAQILHESGAGTVLFENLRYTTAARLLQIFGVGNHSAAITAAEAPGLLGQPEALAERVYGLGNPKKAKALGNTAAGDGFRYRGGGLLQTTGRGAYRDKGRRIGVDLEGDPTLIVDARYALSPGLYEWRDGNLNAAADRDDIRTITRVINGGYNGIKERQALFDDAWRLLGDGSGASWEAAAMDKDARWLQQALNDLGASPKLKVDGRYGPATTAAVEWFQALAHLQVDGVAGDVTRAAIKLRLAA